MDYNETVNNVMSLLKDKGVCASSRKSHEDCYRSLEDFMAERNESYSSELRASWINHLRTEQTNQKCIVWEQYALQLEEMHETGTISDRRLFLNRSDYEKLSLSWRELLDAYLDSCRVYYTDSTLELTRIYCSKALLLLTYSGITSIDDLSYDAIFILAEASVNCNEKTKRTILNNASRMFDHWSHNGWCSSYFSMLLDSRVYPHVGRIEFFSSEHRDAIASVAELSMEFPAKEFRESIAPFVEALEKHGYVGTTLNLAKHALTALHLFLEIHSLGFHQNIMWAWFEEIKDHLGSSWLHWRRILRMYEDYTIYGDIVTVGKYQYGADALSLLPAWCEKAIKGFLEQKRHEFRKEGTIRSYRYPCIRFCRYLVIDGHKDFMAVTPNVIKAFAAQDSHNTFKGKATCFVVVREFLQYLCENSYTNVSNLDRCLMTGSAPEEKIVDVLTDEQIDRIYSFRKDHREAIELRDTAIVLLGLRMGFRSSDVLNLKFKDIDWRKQEISIIMSKTDTQISLPMPVDVGNAIYAYISKGRPKSESEYIFVRTKAPYNKLTGKVCTKALYRILPERRSVTGGGFHVTRRTFATSILRNRAGIDEVMDALGHRDPTSVMKYLLLDDERSRMCGLSLKDAGISPKGGLA